jgi:hypothetical protein
VHTLHLIGAIGAIKLKFYACLLLEYCPKAGGKPSSAVCAIEVEKADMNELDEKHGHEGQPVSWAEVLRSFHGRQSDDIKGVHLGTEVAWSHKHFKIRRPLGTQNPCL